MRTLHLRIALVVVVFALALGGGLLFLSKSDGGSSSGGGHGKVDATSDVWKVGTHWTVDVRQDSASITPDAGRSVAMIPFHFSVVSAPNASRATWKVHVAQDGAQGPFAKGWNLYYVDKGATMQLSKVSVGDEQPAPADAATIVLGAQFPYETTYASRPTNKSLDAAKLLDRATLPPTSMPDGNDSITSGATPPANAPSVGAGQVPPGAPAGVK
jgi:hypothetical protein